MEVLGAPPPAPGTPGPFALADRDHLRALLDGAGFDDVAIEVVDDVREWESPEAWWEGMTGEGGVIGPLLDHVEPQQAERMRRTALASAAAFAGEAGVRFPAALLVASARRPTSAGTSRR
jgi:hypothetical protein